MDLGLSGLASGFDWKSFIDQMMNVERAPQLRLKVEQSTLQQKKAAYAAIKTELTTLQTRVDALKDSTLFDSRSITLPDPTVASATAGATSPLGVFNFNFTQLATAAKLNGASNIGAPISATNDVSGVILSSSGLSTTVSAGTFTLNGKQVTVDPAGSLQDLFNAISTATAGAVTAAYDSATDKITFSSVSEIILGSSTDTSNFLQATKLYNNGTGAVSSAAALGGIRRSATLAAGNLATALNDGGAGQRSFKINGVAISYSATADNLNSVITRINNSDAGVTASYDQVNDRIILTNKTTGDIGVAVEDVTGNFAAASGLGAGTLQHGNNLFYSIDGGPTMVSQTNTITEESSGIAGLSVTALAEGETDINVGSDSSKIKTAITDFITQYNKVQSLIDTDTASSTDSNGKVTVAILANESDISDIASSLRATAFATISGFAATMNQFEDIGIATSGNDNSLTLKDEDKLDAALANNLTGLKKLFTDSADGIAVKLSAYVKSLSGDDGKLEAKDGTLTKNISDIDTQVADMERIVQQHKDSLTAQFVAMEQAQQQINQQLQFLAQRFGTSSSSTAGK